MTKEHKRYAWIQWDAARRRRERGARLVNPLHGFAIWAPFLDVVQDAGVRVRPASDLETLFRKEGPRIWRALFAYAADRDVASDAVAEAFAQALARGNELRSPERWVWKVAFRVAAGEMKDRRRREPQLPAGSVYEMPDLQHDLVAALPRLTANQRAALVLRHYAGYSTREVATILGCSSATVRVHLSQGRRRLRRLLEDRGE